MKKLTFLGLIVSFIILVFSIYTPAEENDCITYSDCPNNGTGYSCDRGRCLSMRDPAMVTNTPCNKSSPCSDGLVCVKFPDKQNSVCAVYPPTNYYSCPEGYSTQLEDPAAEREPFIVKCLTQMEVNADRCQASPSECPGELINEGKNNNGCDKIKCIKTLSNGIKSEIKIMPAYASQIAIQRLGELEFTVELKETGNTADPLAYYLEAEKEGKIFGLFRAKGKVIALVNAETGELIKVKNPWWSFLASGV